MLAFLWSCSSSALSWPDKYDWQIRKAVKNYLPTVDWRLYKAQLIQESSLRPLVVSHAGAKGLAQFMPGTWADVSSKLQLVGSPFDPHLAIPAGAFYMSQLRQQWHWKRPERDQHNLALASYNVGLGNMLKAQRLCKMAVLYEDIARCLHLVPNVNEHETLSYVVRIRRYHKILKENY